MDMYYQEYRYHRRSFEHTYRCYPVSSINKQHLEHGDKILMPQSALDYLASLQIEYPMLFELSNPSAKRVSHCGVMEFTAEEGSIFLPYWMMQNMLLQEGDTVVIKNAALPKGTFVKLQPHTKDFLDISNPKAILEKTLRSFSCMTTGDTIMVTYNSKNYFIDILETKPAGAISIIETDCEVDFAPPLDYQESEKPATSTVLSKTQVQGQENFQNLEPSFSPFTGIARRLNGKPSEPFVAPTSSALKEPQQIRANGIGSTSIDSTSSRPSGKLIFGSNTNQISKSKEINKVSASPQLQKEEEPKFKAFSGKSYSLKS